MLRDEASKQASSAAVAHQTCLAVMRRELLTLEASCAEEGAAAERTRERLSSEAKHLQRKLPRLTKESETKMAEERAALDAKLAESARRSDAKLRAERARLAVRYGSKPSTGSSAARPDVDEQD